MVIVTAAFIYRVIILCDRYSFSQQEDSFHQQIRLKFKEETSEVLHLDHSFYGAETWTLYSVDRKYLESFKVCWRRKNIIWTNRVRNKEVLHRVQEEKGTSCVQ